MLIIGAKGHAKDLLTVLENDGYSKPIAFYDDVSKDLTAKLFHQYPVFRQLPDAIRFLKDYPEFCLGLGNPFLREKLTEKFKPYGQLVSVISKHAILGKHANQFGMGLNIMPFCFISNAVVIGEGTLVNTSATIHHDVKIGAYCELMPGCKVLGNVSIGDYCSIGSGAIVLPKVCLGNNVIVGAGAVVTKDIPDNTTVVGVPAKRYFVKF